MHWWNTQRILEPIGDTPPAEFENAYYRDRHMVSRTIDAPVGAVATTRSLRSTLSDATELDNATRTGPTLPSAVTSASPETE